MSHKVSVATAVATALDLVELKPRHPPFPDSGFVREKQILGDRQRGVPPFIPISHTQWWAWVKSGRAPKPIRLGPKVTVWRAEEIRALPERLASSSASRAA